MGCVDGRQRVEPPPPHRQVGQETLVVQEARGDCRRRRPQAGRAGCGAGQGLHPSARYAARRKARPRQVQGASAHGPRRGRPAGAVGARPGLQSHASSRVAVLPAVWVQGRAALGPPRWWLWRHLGGQLQKWGGGREAEPHEGLGSSLQGPHWTLNMPSWLQPCSLCPPGHPGTGLGIRLSARSPEPPAAPESPWHLQARAWLAPTVKMGLWGSSPPSAVTSETRQGPLFPPQALIQPSPSSEGLYAQRGGNPSLTQALRKQETA